jgi:HEAT repeat protein
MVREQCCKLLDHLMDDETITDLVAMLNDPEPRVRISAAHALACDRCKQGSCRPAADDVLPTALRLLKHDTDPHVRAMAIEVVGQWVHQDDRSYTALPHARDHDTDPAVRKKATWYLPGGTIHQRTAPR